MSSTREMNHLDVRVLAVGGGSSRTQARRVYVFGLSNAADDIVIGDIGGRRPVTRTVRITDPRERSEA